MKGSACVFFPEQIANCIRVSQSEFQKVAVPKY